MTLVGVANVLGEDASAEDILAVLAKLHEQGILTDEEFSQHKEKVLSG